MMKRIVVIALVVLLAGCKDTKNANGEAVSIIKRVEQEKKAKRAPVLGQRVLEGEVHDLRASPDGEVLTVLMDASKPTVRGVPPMMRQGGLWAVPSKGGKAVKLGNGVINMPGGWMFTADSKWVLFQAAYDPQKAEGELFVQSAKDLSAERQRIALKATYYVPSDDGAQVAFISDGVLHAGKLPEGPFPQLAGDVSTAEFSADGRYLYFRRKFAAAGGLYQLDLSAAKPEPRRLIDQVTEYTVLRTGKHVVANVRPAPSAQNLELHVFDVATLKGKKLADDAQRYRVSRDGSMLAWRDSAQGPDKGSLSIANIDGTALRQLGDAVNDFDFSPDTKRFVYRDNFKELALGGGAQDSKLVERVGDLMLIELPDAAPKLLVRQAPNFTFAPNSSALAFTQRIDRPEVTRRLSLLPVGAAEPVALKDWLYEYMFSPDGTVLYFRSDCLREGRACELNSISATPGEGDKPVRQAEATFSFRLSQDGQRVLVALAHLTDLTFDLALRTLTTGEQKVIDQYVEWPAIYLPTGGVAYVVKEKSRPGLYVANDL